MYAFSVCCVLPKPYNLNQFSCIWVDVELDSQKATVA